MALASLAIGAACALAGILAGRAWVRRRLARER